MTYYFAYGSNLNKEQMDKRCPGAKLIGTALLKGYELIFKESQTGYYFSVRKAAGGVVPIGVWKITEKDVKELDKREGCPLYYRRYTLELDVKRTDGETEKLSGIIYILPESNECGRPPKKYVDRCRTGFKDFGFDQKFIDDAIARTKKEAAARKAESKINE